MKNSRKKLIFNIIISSIFLIGILIYYIFITVPEIKKKENEGRVKLLNNFDKDNIAMIYIYYNELTNIHKSIISNISNEWYLISPIFDKADTESILKIIDDVAVLTSERIFSNLDFKTSIEYGFTNPTSIIEITAKNGEKFNIKNGFKAKTDNLYYTFVNNNYNIAYLTYTYKYTYIEKNTLQLRNKEIFTINIDDLKYVKIKNTNDTFIIIKNSNNTDWDLKNPLVNNPDKFLIKSKIIDIYGIYISKYETLITPKDYIKKYKFDNPLINIQLISENKTNTLLISYITNEVYNYAYSPEKNGIILIDENDIKEKLIFNKEIFIKKEETNE